MRLNDDALAWRIGGKNIAEVSLLRIDEAAEFFGSLELSDSDRQIGRTMLEQVQSRLGFLRQVGLGYLALDRKLSTLSGGEAQRVALTSALGSSLVNMLYVLDEPSVGLHPADVERLLGSIEGLRDRGNTVVMVEHEEALLRVADRLIEIGPGAGDRGGTVVFEGTLPEMLAASNSVTGDFLAGRRGISAPQRRRPTTRGRIRLNGARGNNLQNVSVDFPLGVLCLVTGVSGSGKSTLVQDTLYGALCKRKKKDSDEPLTYDDVIGDGQIDDVMSIDQSPIGRSARSNPVTYIKAFDTIRAVFAETLEARTHNYTAGHFSFNVDGGRCNACQGEGFVQIDMQFLADVYMKCAQCGGTRFRDEILAVEYRGRNIAEVLDLTVREAFAFFRGQPKVQGKLKQLMDVGLDYLRLGQPANTLSSRRIATAQAGGLPFGSLAQSHAVPARRANDRPASGRCGAIARLFRRAPGRRAFADHRRTQPAIDAGRRLPDRPRPRRGRRWRANRRPRDARRSRRLPAIHHRPLPRRDSRRRSARTDGMSIPAANGEHGFCFEPAGRTRLVLRRVEGQSRDCLCSIAGKRVDGRRDARGVHPWAAKCAGTFAPLDGEVRRSWSRLDVAVTRHRDRSLLLVERQPCPVRRRHRTPPRGRSDRERKAYACFSPHWHARQVDHARGEAVGDSRRERSIQRV